MSLVYRLMYRVGFTPWDTGEVPARLRELVEGEGSLAPGSALDLGCGTGAQAVYMAQHDWHVTGVDDLEPPLQRARDRAAAAGVDVHWVKADVTQLHSAGLQPGYTLALDRGCFHGLSDAQRVDYARGVTDLAASGAVLLLMCFARNRIPAAPAGADREEIATLFAASWELTLDAADSGPGPKGPLGNVRRTWYQLRRR
jgi:cyclopropane fatty-acyl-phospholipid synthase-like methyltransferase